MEDFGKWIANSKSELFSDSLFEFCDKISDMAKLDNVVSEILNPKGFFIDLLRCNDRYAYAVSCAVASEKMFPGSIEQYYAAWKLVGEKKYMISPADLVWLKDKIFFRVIQEVPLGSLSPSEVASVVKSARSEFLPIGVPNSRLERRKYLIRYVFRMVND